MPRLSAVGISGLQAGEDVNPVRWNEQEFLKIRAHAVEYGISFAAALRELALKQAVKELAANIQQDALDRAA